MTLATIILTCTIFVAIGWTGDVYSFFFNDTATTEIYTPLYLFPYTTLFRSLSHQACGPFEERFRRNREELGLVGCAVRIERRRPHGDGIIAQPLVLLAQDAPPGPERARHQDGHAIGGAVLLVQLVRELVEDHVVAVRHVTRAVDDVVPRKHNDAVPPRLPAEWARRHDDFAGLRSARQLRDERVRVDQHGPQRGITRTLQVEQQQARLSRNRHPHLLRDDEPAAPLDVLLRQEHLCQAQQPFPFVRCEPSRQRHATVEDVEPPGRDRLRPEPDLPPPREPSQQRRDGEEPTREARQSEQHDHHEIAHDVDDTAFRLPGYCVVG